MTSSKTSDSAPPNPLRVLFGGLLMGLANLVPGVSGGTMILAMGLYERFIGALADLSRLRFSRQAIGFIALIAIGAGGALVGLSGVAVSLVSESRWVMYSLFIGMTLGGAPELFRESKPRGPAVVVAFALSFALMATLAWGLAGTQVPENTLVFVLMGVLAASSMILPGISGSYMLLIFGMYDVVIGSLSASALREDPMGSLVVLAPVGLGAVLGMGLLSNLLKSMLAKHSTLSHAALLGLLTGSVLGLYPFREPANPELANKPFRKALTQLVAGASIEEMNDKYDLEWTEESAAALRATYAGQSGGDLKQLGDELKPFDPTGMQILKALGLFVLGLGITCSLSGSKKPA
ncbi:MAG: putative membrane protein [Candidatus Paceibacteria bacterium]|jgi:putative membrane protein